MQSLYYPKAPLHGLLSSYLTHPYSVATVMTDVFQKNGIMVRKLAEIMRIFVDIGHIKNQGVIYWPDPLGPIYDLSVFDCGNTTHLLLGPFLSLSLDFLAGQINI